MCTARGCVGLGSIPVTKAPDLAQGCHQKELAATALRGGCQGKQEVTTRGVHCSPDPVLVP
jgi:hypothetical protein